VKLEFADRPTDSIELMASIRSYMDQVQNLSRASGHYTDMLRRRWSSFCPLHHAARSTALRCAWRQWHAPLSRMAARHALAQ
jgi:hypothetical protein